MFKSVADIASSLKAFSVADGESAKLLGRARTYVSLVASPIRDEAGVPLGATKIGGRPDLPIGSSWPWRQAYPDHEQRIREAEDGADRFGPDELNAAAAEVMEELRRHIDPASFEALGMAPVDFSAIDLSNIVESARRTAAPAPLGFVAQVDLATVARTGSIDPDIPGEGRLLLFYDVDHQPGGWLPDDHHGARLIYDRTPASRLARLEPPAGLEALVGYRALPALACEHEPAVAPPSPFSPDWTACRIREAADESLRRWWSQCVAAVADHRVGGHPIEIQGSMQTDCALVSGGVAANDAAAMRTPAAMHLKENAGGWLLLLQIASSERGPMRWGDDGILYVWIHRDALRARRFEDVRVMWQCY